MDYIEFDEDDIEISIKKTINLTILEDEYELDVEDAKKIIRDLTKALWEIENE